MHRQTEPNTPSERAGAPGLRAMGLRLVAMKFLTSVGMLGSYFVGILGTLTYSSGGDVVANVLAVGAINFAQLFGTFACGSLLDARGPRTAFALVVGGTCIAAAAYQVLAFSVPGVILGALLFGFAWGTGEVVQRSFPAYLSDDTAELGRVNAQLSMAVNVAVVVGPLACGAMAVVMPARYVLLFAAAGSLAALVPATGFRALREPGAAERAGEEASLPGARGAEAAASDAAGTDGAQNDDGGFFSALAGIKVVAAEPVLRVLVVAGFLTFFGYGAFDPLESLFYRDVLHVGVEWMGWLSSASGVGALFGAFAVMRLPARRMNLGTLLLVLVGLGAGSLVYVSTPFVGVALTGQLLLGAAFGALMPLETTLVQTHAPLGTVGRVSAIMGFSYTFAGVVPLFMAPQLAGLLGVQGALVAASSCVFALPLGLLAFLRLRMPQTVRGQDRTEAGA